MIEINDYQDKKLLETRIVSLIGSSGSGKSVIASLLAQKLASNSYNVLVIHSDANHKELNYLYTNLESKNHKSIGEILNSARLTKKTLEQAYHFLNHNDFLAIVGYSFEENQAVYPQVTTKNLDKFLSIICEDFDVIIFDATNNISSEINQYFLAKSNYIFSIINPSYKSIDYYQSIKSLLKKLNNYAFKKYHIINYNRNSYSINLENQLDGVKFVIDYYSKLDELVQNKLIDKILKENKLRKLNSVIADIISEVILK